MTSAPASVATEPPANLAGCTVAMLAALIGLHRGGAAARCRNFYLLGTERHQVSVVTALAARGLVKVTCRGSRFSARLTEQGHWYARTAIARWSSVLAA